MSFVVSRGSRKRCWGAVRLALASGALTTSMAAWSASDISSDGSLGTVVTPGGNVFAISGGTIKGSNQLHSFGQFDVGAGDIASFGGPASIQNILGRVTGGTVSSIEGTLRSTIPGANLYLMNPSGMVFGPNASLDLSGSFFGTSADFIGLSDGQQFNAVPSADDALLTSAPPTRFGFLSQAPRAIEVRSGSFDFSSGGFTNALTVPVGESISLIGGDIAVGPQPGGPPAGFVFAPAGSINLVSVASPGSVEFNSASAGNLMFALQGFSDLGTTTLSGSAILDGARVSIQGGRFHIDSATIFPGITWLAGLPVPPPNGGVVNVDVEGDVTITGGQFSLAPPGIQIFNGSETGLVGGDAPSVAINSGSISMSGEGTQITANRWGPGAASDFHLSTGLLNISDGASVGLFNFFEGAGGSLRVVAGEVRITSSGSTNPTGLFAQSDFHPAYGQPGVPFLPFFQLADSASIALEVDGSLNLSGDASITTDSFALGRSGDIDISAGSLVASGLGPTSGAIAAQSGIAGASGGISITTDGPLSLSNGFRISATTFGSGDAGAVNVVASGRIDLNGANSRILSATTQAPDEEYDAFARRFDAIFQLATGTPIPDYTTLRNTLGVPEGPGDLMVVLQILSTLQDPGGNPLIALNDFEEGQAGSVAMETPELSLAADTRIETSTGWNGAAGAVQLTVGSLTLTDGATIRSRSGVERLDGSISVGDGPAGRVTVSASGDDGIRVAGRSSTSGDGSSIATSTLGSGSGGSIALTAPLVSISNGGEVAATTTGSGNAGEIAITSSSAAGVSIQGAGSAISTSTTAGGAGGAVLIRGPTIGVLGGGVVTASSRGAGDAGTVTMEADSLIEVAGEGSEVSTSAFASGSGGAIALEANVVAVGAGGKVSADSSGTGLTGDIGIRAGDAIRMLGGTVSTSARTSDGGNIQLLAPSIIQLTDAVLSTSVESGTGGGGNIDVDPKFVVLNASRIIANAFGGPGGNIRIVAENFVPSADSVVQASSQLGVQGSVVIESPENDIAGQIAKLPSSYLSTDDLLPERCAARRRGAESSFVIVGNEGLPTEPDGYLPSFHALSSEKAVGSTASGARARVPGSRPDTVMLAMLQPSCTK